MQERLLLLVLEGLSILNAERLLLLMQLRLSILYAERLLLQCRQGSFS